MGLSIWQLKRQLAYLAGLAAWEESPQGLVYNGGAFVSEDLEGNFRMGSVLNDGPAFKTGQDNDAGDTPFCRVRCIRTEWDRRSNDSRIERAVFQLWSTAGGGHVPGTTTQARFDTHGINQVTGANRADTNGQGQSQGRDVDELIGRLVEEFGGHFIDSEHGFQGRAAATDVMRKVSGSSVLKRALEVEAFNTLQSNYYHPARNMSVALINSAHQFFLNSGNVSPGDLFRVFADGTNYDFVAGTDFAIAGGGVSLTAVNLKNAINAADIGVVATSSTQFVNVVRGDAGSGLTLSCTGTGNLAGNTNGNVSFTWDLPPMRFDTLKGVLRRGTAAGDPAPATASDGTDVPIGALAPSATSSFPGVGTWNYSYFMGYAETPQAVADDEPDRYSAKITGSILL
jgi:hypothetical protein